MRLRSNCTSQKRTTHRALRLALAMTLVGAPSVACAVEELPPACTAAFSYPGHAEAGLLPYPFESACQTSQAKQTATAQRLVRLVGLQSASFAAGRGATASQRIESTLPYIELDSMTPSVVAASATAADDGSRSSQASNNSGHNTAQSTAVRLPQLPQLPSTAQPLALPTAPDMPDLLGLAAPVALPATLPTLPSTSSGVRQAVSPQTVSRPSEPAVAPVGSSADSLSESLMDIKIPMDGAQGAPVTPVTSHAEATRQKLPATGPQLSARSSNSGLVQPTQPLQLLSTAAESVSPPGDIHRAASTTVAPAPAGRMPGLVQVSESVSIAKPTASSSSVSFSFSDSPTTESASSQVAVSSKQSPSVSAADDRRVSLHLSSASQVPLKTSPLSIQLPQRAPGMQVRVEGEPAQLPTTQAIRGIDRDLPTAPRPSMESAPRVASDTRGEHSSSAKKIKASFASRTSQLPEDESLGLVEKRGSKAGQPGETLSVGLQESQVLSAEHLITELSVEHPEICQLMQTGEKSVSLIGMRPGSTRIALIMINGGGERQVEIHEVSVGPSARAELGLSGLAKEISLKVAKLVPHSDVEIVAYTDYLLVHGFTPYESDAKKILALVRKTSLVPVVDQLKTNER